VGGPGKNSKVGEKNTTRRRKKRFPTGCREKQKREGSKPFEKPVTKRERGKGDDKAEGADNRWGEVQAEKGCAKKKEKGGGSGVGTLDVAGAKPRRGHRPLISAGLNVVQLMITYSRGKKRLGEALCQEERRCKETKVSLGKRSDSKEWGQRG